MKRTKLITRDNFKVINDMLMTMDRLDLVDYLGVVTIDHSTGECAVVYKGQEIVVIDEEDAESNGEG